MKQLIFFSPDFAHDTKAATGFMIAYLHAVRDLYDAFFRKQGRDAVIADLIKALSIKDAKLWEEMAPQVPDLNGEVDIDDLQSQAAFYKSEGTLSSVPDLHKFVDLAFVHAATAVIGSR
jgi:hypothetical protein